PRENGWMFRPQKWPDRVAWRSRRTPPQPADSGSTGFRRHRKRLPGCCRGMCSYRLTALTDAKFWLITPCMDNASAPDRPGSSRRKRLNAADEASMSLTKPIANWQAKFAWFCAMWGLLPVVGLVLGAIAVTFGAIGWLRVRMRPDDLGIRHAIGSVLLGSI